MEAADFNGNGECLGCDLLIPQTKGKPCMENICPCCGKNKYPGRKLLSSIIFN